MRLFKFIIIPYILIFSNYSFSNDNNINNDVFGVNTYYTVKDKDTLIKIARNFNISFADILSANDVNMDPWIPEKGKKLLIPKSHILPFGKRNGILINIGALRLYYYEDGKFIGDTRKGGPCNFETYSFTPHCNGTHTECIGHIIDERVSIHLSLKDIFFTSTLISVHPTKNKESYIPELNTNDLVITKELLYNQLNNVPLAYLDGIIIRTTPNLSQKTSIDYMKNPPPFFTIEAMKYIRKLGVKHLLVDIPSVDRLFDLSLIHI